MRRWVVSVVLTVTALAGFVARRDGLFYHPARNAFLDPASIGFPFQDVGFNSLDGCDVDKPYLMPIEDVFTITGRGTVVTGRVERGGVHVNDEVEIVGLRDTTKTVCTGVEMFRKLLDEGQAGDNVGILLRGTKRGAVERGQVLAKPGSITPNSKFECEVYVLSKEE